jgi:hypothetical protein
VPSEVTKDRPPSASWPGPSRVTGPCWTSNSTLADREAGGPVVAHLHDAVLEVESLDLGEGDPGADALGGVPGLLLGHALRPVPQVVELQHHVRAERRGQQGRIGLHVEHAGVGMT